MKTFNKKSNNVYSILNYTQRESAQPSFMKASLNFAQHNMGRVHGIALTMNA